MLIFSPLPHISIQYLISKEKSGTAFKSGEDEEPSVWPQLSHQNNRDHHPGLNPWSDPEKPRRPTTTAARRKPGTGQNSEGQGEGKIARLEYDKDQLHLHSMQHFKVDDNPFQHPIKKLLWGVNHCTVLKNMRRRPLKWVHREKEVSQHYNLNITI